MTAYRTTLPRSVRAVLWTSMLVGLGGVVIAIPALPLMWALVPVLALAAVAAVACSTFTVRMSADGISAVSVLGRPRVDIGAEEIAEVTVGPVSAVGDFLGWGFRIRGRGDYGIITRGGEALVVTTENGRTLTVTLDEAQRAAAELRSAIGR